MEYKLNKLIKIYKEIGENYITDDTLTFEKNEIPKSVVKKRGQLKYWYGKFSPILLSQILQHSGSTGFWDLPHQKRYEIIMQNLKEYKERLYKRFGGQSAYQRGWLRRRGLRKIDYLNMTAIDKGYENNNKYLDSIYQKLGFESRADIQRFRRIRKFFHKSISDFYVRECQLRREAVLKTNHRMIRNEDLPNMSFSYYKLPKKEEEEVEQKLQKFILMRQNMRKNKMKKEAVLFAVDDSSILPKGVCKSQKVEADELMSIPSNGENLRMPLQAVNYNNLNRGNSETELPLTPSAELRG